MFRGLGNLFHGSNPPKPNSPREDSDYSLISMFSQNIAAFSSIDKRDPVKKDLFIDLISHFQIIFNKANPKQLSDEETKNILINYLKICSENGSFIFDGDETVIDNYFDSIIFTASLFDNIIPNADLFFEFFCSLVNKIQENQIFLKNSQIFLLILFKSPHFFAQFLLNDGLCIVFSSIFLKNDESFLKTQEIFLELIFKSSPQEIFSQIPFSNVTSFNVFLDMLKPIIDDYTQQKNMEEKKKLYLKNACVYVSLYIKSFSEICPSLINDFNTIGGFSILNNIFIYDSDDKSSAECYKILLENSEMNKIVFEKLYDLYQNEETNSNIRTSIISFIFMDNQSSFDDSNMNEERKEKINEFIKQITKIAPISSLFKRPPFLNKKGLKYCAYLIKFVLKQNLNKAKSILNLIMSIIGFPEDDQIPADLYIQLLIDEFQTGELNVEMLLDNQCNFVQNFVLKPSAKEMTSYYHHYKIAFTLLYYVFLSNKAKLYRYDIIQKFVQVLNYIFGQQQQIKNDDEQRKVALDLECNQYIDFIFSLLESSFSVQNCKLLLSYIENPPIMKVLTLIMKVRSENFDLFVKSNGFSYLNSYIQKYSTKSNYLSVLKLLCSMAYFHHHYQIDEWILNQPINSPLFKLPKELMEKAAMGIDSQIDNEKIDNDPKLEIKVLHIPSFLPFCDDFDYNFEYNLYLAGRFGVPAFIKMGIPINKIPHISMIANRFITPELIRITFRDNMKLIPEFANINRPHFPLFELIPKSYNILSSNSMPENAPTFLNFEKQFASFSFWFRLPIIDTLNNQNIYLVSVSPKLLEIAINNEDLIIKTNKEKTKVSKIIDDNWHNVIVSFIGKRNIINTVNIRIDNLTHTDLIELKIEEQSFLPSSLVFGDIKKSNFVPIQFSKNIILSENVITANKANTIFLKGLYHPMQKIKCSKRSQYAFEVHYLGFPSYYKNKVKIENIFDFLDHLESIDDFKYIFNVLLNLQLLNNINFNYFWHRIIISLKRKKELISNELSYFVHIATKPLLDVELRTKEINIFLSDTEFYFIFDFQSIKNLLDSILSDNSIDWNCLENYDLTNSLLSIIKSGIKEDIQLLLVPVLNKLLKANQTALKLKSFMNSVISMSDLSYTFDMFNTMIQFDELIRIPKAEDASNSEVIIQLLNSFVESAKICFEEVYTLKQLLILMYLYSDEKAVVLADLLAFYSNKNPNYLKNYPQNLVNYIFSQLSEYSKMWKSAISILTSELTKSKNKTQSEKKYPTLFIKKPTFVPVILGMLESLASKCSYHIIQQKGKKSSNNNLKLFCKVVNKLLNIEPTQFYLLYQEKNCDKYLNSLLFLGIIPNSYISDSNDNLSNRSAKILSTFSIDPPSKNEVKDIISLTTYSPLFSPINVPEKFYNEQQTIRSNSHLNFPNDLEDCKQLIDFIDESNILELFISILFAENDNSVNMSIDSLSSINNESSSSGNDNDNEYENASNGSDRFKSKSPDLLNIPSKYFEKYLLDFLNGTALMYINYWREIANRLIFKILNRIYTSNIPNSINYLKSTFEGIHKCIISGVFSENYLDLVELVFLIFKKGEFTIDQFLSDDKYLEFYREFLLMTFYFSPLQKKNYKYDINSKDPIFDILMKNKDFVFIKIIFNENKFASLWLHASRIYNQEISANLRNENNNDAKITIEKNSNEDKETDPGICCMSFLLAVIDNSVVSSYDPAAMTEAWNSFLSRYLFDQQDIDLKINKMNSIIKLKQNMKTKAAKYQLISHIFRAVNLSVEQNLAFYKINIRQRQNERMMFLHNQIQRKRKLANANVYYSLSKNKDSYINSFHLSPLSYPICQPRAITPSPFIIKPPPSSSSSKDSQNESSTIYSSSKSGYAIDYFKCKERIQAIEKCGLLNCSPEWCYFNSNENKSEFSSVFEYSQIIEQGPPSTLSLFEDAFNEYFSSSTNSSTSISLSALTSISSLTSLSTITSLSSITSLQSISSTQTKKCNYLCFNVSFLYYIHTIPSVLFLTENYLLIVILAKGSLQLISRPENPVAFLPFSENVALGEYNNKTSIFCGHVVITIKYDHILKMNSHLYIHKNVGLIISSLRSADVILIFNSTNEMKQANNFIVSNRNQKQQLNIKQKRKQTDIQQLNKQFNTNQQKDLISKAKSIANPPLLNASNSITSFGLSLNLSQNSNFLSLDQLQIFPPCPNLLLFTVDSLSSASLLWKNNIISNFDYLLLLNSFGGRSFLDLTQYPVVPWIAKPDIKESENINEDSDSKNEDNNNNKIKKADNENNNNEKSNEIEQKEEEFNASINQEDKLNDEEKEEDKLNDENKEESKLNNDEKENELNNQDKENKSNENEIQQQGNISNSNAFSENCESIQTNQIEEEESINDEYENEQRSNGKEIEFQMRNLSLPMGQLSKSRSRHFDQTYELSAPKKYFYGFHYSLPGAVFWLLMRTPPFTFFLWDLNDGWDNSQRLFVSLSDAYNSASSTNPSDLKELVPALYQVPESLTNVSKIELNVSNDDVILPSWSNCNPFFFTETHLRLLNSTNQIQKWIDLIFGYKQDGDVAIEFKNLFLPSSYHNSCAEDLEMDQESYNSQVLNFGQCPIQLFKRAHPFKLNRSVSHSPSFEFLKKKPNSATSTPKKKRKTEDVLSKYIVSDFLHVSSAPNSKKLIPTGIKTSTIRPRVSSTSARKNHPYPSTPVPTYTKKINPFTSNSLKVKSLFNERENLVRSQNNSPIPPFFNSSNQVFRGASDLWSWEMKDILTSGELINPLNLRSFVVAPIEKVFIALPKDAVFYPLKCSGSTFFFIIDKELESLSFIRMSESMEIVFVKFSSKFAFANHLTVSDDGMFIAISFSFGRVVVYRVIFDENGSENENRNDNFISNFIKNINSTTKNSFLSTGCPKGIEKFGSYSNKIIPDNINEEKNNSMLSFSCRMSALLPQDFICASAFDDGSVILWNFATETRHRILWPYHDLMTDSIKLNQINSNEKENQNCFNTKITKTNQIALPVSMIFDPFDAVLTVAFSSGIIQYSLNGFKLRDYKINSHNKNENPIDNSNFITDEEDTIEIDSTLDNEFENTCTNRNPFGNKINSQANSNTLSISCIGILGLDFMFNKRLLIAGLSDGSLRLLSASSNNYMFEESGKITAHDSSVSSILCQHQMMRVVTVDFCGFVRLLDFSSSLDQTSVIVRCSYCDNPQSTICKMCQMPICNGCIINGTGLCRNCYQK